MPTDSKQRIENIKQRTDAINNKKLQAQAQVEVLQQQYNQKVEELKVLGVADLNNLPQTIQNLEQELEMLLSQAEVQLSQIEEQIK